MSDIQNSYSTNSAPQEVVPSNKSVIEVTLFDRLYSFFFGDDIFISHSRIDGIGYARSLARLLQKKHRFACYADFHWTEAGEKLPQFLIRKLKRSTVLIVVITKGGVNWSKNIREEIQIFKKTRRPIFVIDLDNSYNKNEWTELNGINVVKDSADVKHLSHTAKRPSTQVLQGIRDSFRYKSKYDIQRKSAFAAFSLIVISILTAIITGFYALQIITQARSERDLAVQEKNRATIDRDFANQATQAANDEKDRSNEARNSALSETAEAKKDLSSKQTRLAQVNLDLVKAKSEKEKAETSTKKANEEKQLAERLADEKKEEVERFAYVSEIKKATYAYENYDLVEYRERLDSILPKYRDLDWNYLNQLTAGSIKLKNLPDEKFLIDMEYSADGRYLFTCGASDRLLRWDLKTGISETLIDKGPKDTRHHFVISPDRDSLAYYDRDGSDILVLTNISARSPQKFVITQNLVGSFDEVVFTPDGNGLITIQYEFKGRSITAQGWNIKSGRKMGNPKIKLLTNEIFFTNVVSRNFLRVCIKTTGEDCQSALFDSDLNEVSLPKFTPNFDFYHVFLSSDRKRNVIDGYDDEKRGVFVFSQGDNSVAEISDELLKSDKLGDFDGYYTVSDDGKLLAMKLEHGIRIIDLQRNLVTKEFRTRTESLTPLSFPPSRDFLVIGNSNFEGDITIWNLTEEEPFTFAEANKTLDCKHCQTGVSADATRAFTLDQAGNLTVWDVSSKKRILEEPNLTVNQNEERIIKFLGGGAFIFSYVQYYDGKEPMTERSLKIWNLEKGKEISLKLESPCDSNYYFPHEPDTLTVTCGDKFEEWNLRSGEKLSSFEIESRKNLDSAKTQIGTPNLQESRDENLDVDNFFFTRIGGKLLPRQLRKEMLTAHEIRGSSDGKWSVLAFGGIFILRNNSINDQRVRLEESRFLGVSDRLSFGFRGAFSKDAKFLMIYDQGLLRRASYLIDLTTLKTTLLIREKYLPLFSEFGFSDSGFWGIMVSTSLGVNNSTTTFLWDTIKWNRREIHDCRPLGSGPGVFTSNETRYVVGCPDGTVKFWDPFSGQEVLSLKAHEHEITQIVFSPDKKFMLTVSEKEGAKLWRMKL